MRINICNYEQGFNLGILSKYAIKMQETLVKLGHDAYITRLPDGKADVTHHLNYISYKPSGTIDTTMVTHITPDQNRTTEDKVNLIKEQEKTALGIAMSPKMEEDLKARGVTRITSVLPAHDSIPRRHQVVAVLTNAYPDGRKREWMFKELCKTIDNKKWAFRIMGSGWHEMLSELVLGGLNVDYFAEFNLDIYKKILDSSDYLLYTGMEDCLAQSIIDAAQAGLKIIAPPQYDIEVDYPFNSQEELNQIFKNLYVNKVEDWTWDNYCLSHLKIWQNEIKLRK